MILFIISAVVFFAIFSFIAERKAPEEYSKKINTLDELACQNYENRTIMQWGYWGFGILIVVGILININSSIKEFHYSIPLLFYSGFMILAGLFSAKPFEHLVFYSISESKKHTIFMQLAEFSIGLLIMMKLIIEVGTFNRVFNVIVLIVVLYSSIMGGRSSNKRGLYERMKYFAHFFWLIYANSSLM
ncbi:MAG: hypothetical protein JXR64_05675 [Spirochaetales bacterium]|nr:hypothetical protein [Spirochaetales bacterium]